MLLSDKLIHISTVSVDRHRIIPLLGLHEWHHFVYVLDTDKFRYFIDGVQVETDTSKPAFTFNLTDPGFLIG
jgi:ribosomal protein L30/L7E